MQKIYISRYFMQSRQGLNSRSHSTTHEGALIRVEENGVSGFGCLHPWVELGDTSLDLLVNQLKEGRISRQVKCALHCADLDRNARAEGVSLFDGLAVPDSHATIVGGLEPVGIAVEQGFDTVKLKLGRDEQSNIGLVREVNNAFPKLRLRFDFNGVLGAGQIVDFVEALGDEICAQIDFLEDPCALSEPVWEKLRDVHGVKTAVDRGIHKVEELEFDYSVLKPAINNVEKLCDAAQSAGRNVVVTSYMDHPVGQCYAALVAGQLEKKYLGLIDQRCGLMTHGLYEPTAFTERLGQKTPHWKTSHGGTGLGFDDLLDELEWERL